MLRFLIAPTMKLTQKHLFDASFGLWPRALFGNFTSMKGDNHDFQTFLTQKNTIGGFFRKILGIIATFVKNSAEVKKYLRSRLP